MKKLANKVARETLKNLQVGVIEKVLEIATTFDEQLRESRNVKMNLDENFIIAEY